MSLPKDAANRTVNAALLGHEDTWGLAVGGITPELLPPPTEGEGGGVESDADFVVLATWLSRAKADAHTPITVNSNLTVDMNFILYCHENPLEKKLVS